jgi:aminopeptidase N
MPMCKGPRVTPLCALLLAISPLGAASAAHAAEVTREQWLDGSLPARDARDHRVDVEHLDLQVRLDLQAGRVDGTATYRIRRREGAPPLLLEAGELQRTAAQWLRSATDKEGSAATVVTTAAGWRIDWPQAADEVLWLRLQWTVQPRRGMVFVRPDRDEPNRPWHVWTQGEAEEARHWLPCPDDPDERLTWTVTIDLPERAADGQPPLVALSNGDPQPRVVQAGRSQTTYRSPWPMPIYLLNVAAGPFERVEHRGGAVPLQSWLLPADVADGRRAFARLPQIFDALQQWLGVRYPFSRYGQVVVHEFHFGGMENTSLTTLAHRNLPDARSELDHRADGLLAHELAHQWFGDLVTCRTWGEIWLNEGFASYLTAVADELLLGADRFAEQMAGMRQGYLREAQEKQRPLSLDRFEGPDGLFDGHAYAKGAWVAHMLRRKLGDAVFRKGIAQYLEQHRFQSVDRVDLRRALEAASGQSLRAFFRRWVEEAGHPQLAVSLRWDAEARQLVVAIDQKQKPGPAQPLFDVEVTLALRMAGADAPQLHTLRLDRSRREWTLPLAARPAVIELDPQMALLADWSVEAAAEDLAAMARLGSSADVRLRAVKDLSRHTGSAVALAALQHAVTADAARHVRQEAATVLGKAPRDKALPMLLQVLRGPQGAGPTEVEAGVRAAAATALGELRGETAWDGLTTTARDDASHAVQRAALQALVAIDRTRARTVLLQAVQWPSFRDRVQVTALQALAQLGVIRDWPIILAAAVPGKPKTLREGAALAVGQFAHRVYTCRDDARQLLENMLHEQSESLRVGAMQGLEAMGDVAARPALLAAADRAADPAHAARLRKAAEAVGRQTPLEERVRQLEADVQALQRR